MKITSIIKKIKILAFIERIKEIKADIIKTQKENEKKLLEIYYKLDKLQKEWDIK